ncbi:MAG: hypothetical protein KAR00_02885 [Candidatus Pacebacteria bacterium]|nr:hypothetical protein [Candidatus Paceibacterota bacterium]
MAQKIHTIITHERPHLDEIVAIWLLLRFGEETFPEIQDAKINFWRKEMGNRSSAKREQEGILCIGCGGGRFDEHPTEKKKRKKNECSSTLVAKELEVDDCPSLNKIIAFAKSNDLEGSGHPFDIAHLATLLYEQKPNANGEVINWVMQGITAKYEEQRQFWTKTKTEFLKNALVEEIHSACGKLKLATVVSGDPIISKFARSRAGGNISVVIQKQPSGHTQIFTNQRMGIRLEDVARILRVEERAVKNIHDPVPWSYLVSEGKISGAEEWYFHEKLQVLLNGSKTASDAPLTQLSLEKIKEIVKIGLNSSVFEPKRASVCSKGSCSSSKKKPCPWYSWGLSRCRGIRFNSYHKGKK